DDPLAFSYRDYDAESAGVPLPTDPVILGNTTPASSYQSVDICPNTCTPAAWPPYPGLFYQVAGHIIAAFRADTDTALTPVRLLTPMSGPVPLTTFKFERPDPAKPDVFARSLAGGIGMPTGFRLSVVVGGKRVVLDADPVD